MQDSNIIPHSGDYFGEQRDLWWNRDFLGLFRQRWDLQQVSTVLDVGCGIGHWGRAIGQVLPNTATLMGVDMEPKWVEKSRAIAKEYGLDKRFSYQAGDATKLNFPDDAFDMVTCQTLLIHLQDPIAALKEFLRVLKPGGLLAVAEPNNLAPSLFFSSLNFNSQVDEVLEGIKFQFICERGKQSLGEGNNSVGDQIPGYFAKLNVSDIQVYLSDKCIPFYPPYTAEEQRICIEGIKDNIAREFGIWDKETTKRYFIAGYKHEYPKAKDADIEQQFTTNWQDVQKGHKEFLLGLQDKSLSASGGSVMYLVSGRKEIK